MKSRQKLQAVQHANLPTRKPSRSVLQRVRLAYIIPELRRTEDVSESNIVQVTRDHLPYSRRSRTTEASHRVIGIARDLRIRDMRLEDNLTDAGPSLRS